METFLIFILTIIVLIGCIIAIKAIKRHNKEPKKSSKIMHLGPWSFKKSLSTTVYLGIHPTQILNINVYIVDDFGNIFPLENIGESIGLGLGYMVINITKLRRADINDFRSLIKNRGRVEIIYKY